MDTEKTQPVTNINSELKKLIMDIVCNCTDKQTTTPTLDLKTQIENIEPGDLVEYKNSKGNIRQAIVTDDQTGVPSNAINVDDVKKRKVVKESIFMNESYFIYKNSITKVTKISQDKSTKKSNEEIYSSDYKNKVYNVKANDSFLKRLFDNISNSKMSDEIKKQASNIQSKVKTEKNNINNLYGAKKYQEYLDAMKRFVKTINNLEKQYKEYNYNKQNPDKKQQPTNIRQQPVNKTEVKQPSTDNVKMGVQNTKEPAVTESKIIKNYNEFLYEFIQPDLSKSARATRDKVDLTLTKRDEADKRTDKDKIKDVNTQMEDFKNKKTEIETKLKEIEDDKVEDLDNMKKDLDTISKSINNLSSKMK